VRHVAEMSRPGNLDEALGELALAVKTVQRMLVDKGVCSQEELHGMLKRVDLEDGKADGRAPMRSGSGSVL